MPTPEVFKSPIIPDQPLPNQGELITPFTKSDTKEVFQPTTIKQTPLPTRRIAVELIGSALNTKSMKVLGSFKLVQSGGFQIGTFVSGISGDLRITPNGITTRNKAGITTFAINGDTGDVVFLGSIQAGSVITGIVAVGDNSIVIDGEARRMVFYDPDTDLPSIIIGNA